MVFFRFPNKSALELLLACGSRWLDVDAVEHSGGNTPLHFFCGTSTKREVLEVLLKSGCHTDFVNKYGLTPFDYVADRELKTLDPSGKNPSKLKCLCARLVAKEQLDLNRFGASTSVLNKFVVLHGAHSEESH